MSSLLVASATGWIPGGRLWPTWTAVFGQPGGGRSTRGLLLTLAAEFSSRNVEFSDPRKDTDDGLRGFELKDGDGYVLFFGRARS